MCIYKVIFVRKKAFSCEPAVERPAFDGKYYCEHRNGEPIYAFIKADSENEAVGMAGEIVREIQQNVFGGDYIN
jgi:hypothetical protein